MHTSPRAAAILAAAHLHPDDLTRDVTGHHIDLLMSQIAATEVQITEIGERIGGATLRVSRFMADGDQLNSAGELQRLGLDYDMAIAKRAQQCEQLNVLVDIFNRQQPQR